MKNTFLLCLISFPAFSFAQTVVKVNECAIQNGVLKEFQVNYNQANGNKTITVNGVEKSFDDVYPVKSKDYADGQSWYVNNETISFNNQPFVKYGLPRILTSKEITIRGLYKGVGVYVESGVSGLVEVIYIPVRRGCEFQPYQLNCGRVSIEPIDTTASAMRFKAVPSGLKGTISYKWTSNNIIIVKGQGTSAITVDTRNRNDGDDFELTLIATDGKNCPAQAFDGFVIVKPGAIKTKKADWSDEERKAFMKTCVPNTQMGEEKGTAYCSCMLEKIVKLYPDASVADKELKREKVMELAKECLQQN